MNTSEDELKALFSRQKGYKRLCFRTKQNGPMCFVEFDDVAHATRALTELYGRGLSNSIKGGIRLSFSKNPLGVRSQGAMGMSNPSTPAMSHPGPNALSGAALGGQAGFGAAVQPPPGFSVPTSGGVSSAALGATLAQYRDSASPAIGDRRGQQNVPSYLLGHQP